MFRLFRFVCLPALVAGGLVIQTNGQDPGPKTGERDEAVKSFVKSYAEAFNKKDLDGVAQAWGEDCTYFDRNTGERIEGRKALRSDLETVFKKQPNQKLAGTVERIKYITESVAQVEGQTVMSSPNEEPLVASFSAILVENGGRWQIASLEETAVPEPQTAHDALKELEWLVGRWVDQGETARVETAVRWSASKNFLLRSFTLHTDVGSALEGTQIIGWDPRARHIRSWVFNADGSFGEGIWSKNGGDWLIKSSQTLADGRAASGTYLLTKIDENALRMQLIGHSIDGTPQPATEPVLMSRAVEETPNPQSDEGQSRSSPQN